MVISSRNMQKKRAEPIGPAPLSLRFIHEYKAYTPVFHPVRYRMTFSNAQTPQGHMPVQMPQPMQYLSSE